MASGFFALLDDIAALMDDVATMTKVSTQKTAGILGDDLAVNAEKASGFSPSRELPVLWAISKGSLLNKIIILPLAFLMSAFIPKMVTVVLVLGGLYLAYEGAEKIYEFLFHKSEKKVVVAQQNISVEELLKIEKSKIKSAIITDFILSVEIVIIALGAVVEESLTTQIIVVSIVALIATVGVYGIVALIVRMDDIGLKLILGSKSKSGFLYHLGIGLTKALPLIIKSLAVIGTLALLLVAGGIFVHNIEFFHHVLEVFPSILRDFIIGLAMGIICLLAVKAVKYLLPKKKTKSDF
jgi:predicted DNA repair protein MutK